MNINANAILAVISQLTERIDQLEEELAKLQSEGENNGAD